VDGEGAQGRALLGAWATVREDGGRMRVAAGAQWAGRGQGKGGRWSGEGGGRGGGRATAGGRAGRGRGAAAAGVRFLVAWI
jgi:hypothetical protein